MLRMIRATALTVAASATVAHAQDYYAGKTINVIVGNVASSGYDPYGRLLARHMGKYIPGKPTIIVQNMPGAGSIKATEYTYVVAPKDGTAITLVMPGALMEPLTGDAAKFRYDATRFAYLGTADSGTRLCLTMAGSKVKTFADAKQTPSAIGATAAGSSLWDYPNFLNALSGAKFKVTTGYPGPGDILIAMERGEVEGVCGLELSTVRSLRPDWIGGAKTNMLLQIAMEPHAEMTRLGIAEMWQHIPAGNRDVAELIVSQQVFQRPFLAPPGTPEPQLNILRAAFMATFKDPETLADAKRMSIEINPRSGEDVEALVKKIYAAPKELIGRMAKAIRP